jgi:RHS repeat-associated protein
MFTGHQIEGNIYFMQARFYDPFLGRFMSPDILVPDPANPQTLNRYAYVTGNPMLFVDPDGLCGLDPLHPENNNTIGLCGPGTTITYPEDESNDSPYSDCPEEHECQEETGDSSSDSDECPVPDPVPNPCRGKGELIFCGEWGPFLVIVHPGRTANCADAMASGILDEIREDASDLGKRCTRQNLHPYVCGERGINAARHCILGARLTIDYDRSFAEGATRSHEANSEDPGDTLVDNHNNEVGFALGIAAERNGLHTRTFVREMCYAYLTGGDLMLSEYDAR